MRNKFFSLFMVMLTVLVVPPLVTSCYQQVVGQEAPEPGGSVVDSLQPDQPDVAPVVAADAESPFSWQNILIVVLGLFSTIFAALWKRARNVITAIDAALKDGKIDKVELNRIIQAWKG